MNCIFISRISAKLDLFTVSIINSKIDKNYVFKLI